MGDQVGLRAAIREVADPVPVMQRVVEEALRLIRHAEGAVVELADGETLTYVCAAGSIAPHVGIQLRIDASLSGLSVRTRETLRCNDAAVDERVDSEIAVRIGAISMICVPLVRGDGAVGVLKVTASQPYVFTEQDVTVLTRLAEFVSETIASAENVARIAASLVDSAAGGDGVDAHGSSGISEFVANVLQPGIAAAVESRHRIEDTLASRAFYTVYQPVIDLATGKLAGCEALTRFGGPSPDVWFADAHRVGLGVQLELAAIEWAIEGLRQLPAHVYLAVNAGPELASSPLLRTMLSKVSPGRIVVEVTEHSEVDDYEALGHALQVLRIDGHRVAVDDTGAGYANFAHILKLAPEFIKLDRTLTTGIDIDPVRRSMAAALVGFAAETGAQVIAEGIENRSELETVHRLGIGYGQGFHLGHPGPIEDLTLAERRGQMQDLSR